MNIIIKIYFERFNNSIRRFVLDESLVEFRNRDEKEHRVYRALKALEPLLSLRSLAAHVDKCKRYFFNCDFCF
jgi:hypothetical protein